jgi:hypothetical protein
MLLMMSPPGFERYLEELAEGLATVGDSEEAAMELRRTLSEKHDIEIVGPPRKAGDWLPIRRRRDHAEGSGYNKIS